MAEEQNIRDKVLHVADLHFWSIIRNPFRLLNKRFLGNINVALRRRHEFPLEQAEPFADHLAETGIAQAILTGDFTSTSTPEEFAMARTFVDGLAHRGLSVTLMPGNHDVYTFEADRRRAFEHCFDDYLPEGGYPAKRTLTGGTDLLVVPTVCANWVSSRGLVSDEAITTVAGLLKEGSGPVIVAAHYPVMRRTYGYHTKSSRALRNADALRQVLGDSDRPILYVAGHVHRFSYTSDPDYENLRHLSTGGFFHHHPAKGCFGEFSEIHVGNEDFTIFRHTHENGWARHAIAVLGPSQ